jgi:hypothetical protein
MPKLLGSIVQLLFFSMTDFYIIRGALGEKTEKFYRKWCVGFIGPHEVIKSLFYAFNKKTKPHFYKKWGLHIHSMATSRLQVIF